MKIKDYQCKECDKAFSDKTILKVHVKQVQANARCLAQGLLALGYHVVAGGTDNHLLLLDLRNKGLTGKDAETALEKAGIITNKNMVPFDTQPPSITSGLRLGTAAITTRGMQKQDMQKIIAWIDAALSQRANEQALLRIKKQVNTYMRLLPLFAR